MTQSIDRIAVTGANGTIARHLIAHLAATGSGRDRVLALVRSEPAARVVHRLPAECRPETRVVDYGDEDDLSKALQGCTRIVHLVGILKEKATARYAEAHETNVFSLARAAENARIRRIVYVSIVGADPESPNRCLASRGRAERILLGRPVPAVILRVPLVLSPGDRATRALRTRARAHLVALVRGGSSREQPMDVNDLVRAIVASLCGPSLDNVVLDLGGPENLSHRELVLRVAVLYGRRPKVFPVPRSLALGFALLAEAVLADPPLTRAMLGVLDHDDRVDAEAACRRLGLALTPLDETLARTLGARAEDA